jgi:hypothetical protein
LLREVSKVRPALASLDGGTTAMETALDAERRLLMHGNEAWLRAYLEAAQAWRDAWPDVEREMAGRPLTEAHAVMARRAEGLLPLRPVGEGLP